MDVAGQREGLSKMTRMKSGFLKTSVLTCLLFTLVGLTACDKEEVVAGINEELRLDNAGVTVTKYETAFIQLDGEAGTVFSSEPVLILQVVIKNHGPNQLTYVPRHEVSSGGQDTIPLLFIDPGDEPDAQPINIEGIHVEPGFKVAGQMTKPLTLEAGEEITDRYLFRIPPDDTDKLMFTFPGQMVSVARFFKFRFSYEPTEVQKPRIYDWTETASLDGIDIKITDAEVMWVKMSDKVKGDVYLKDPVLVIRFTLKNTGDTDVRYHPKHTDPVGQNIITLRDDGGTFYPRTRIPDTSQLAGQVRSEVFIRPNQTLNDMVLFIRPPASIKEIIISFPGQLFREAGLVQFKIPFIWKDPPKPEDLTGPKPKPEPAAPVDGGENPPGGEGKGETEKDSKEKAPAKDK